MAANETIAQKIREAYEICNTGRATDSWVNLNRINNLLDVPKHQFDEVIIDMMLTDKKVFLAPEANQKTLSDDERAAAIRIGGEANHLIAIAG